MFTMYKIIHRQSANHPIIKKFITKYHYLKTLSRGNSHVFCLGIGNKLVGVAMYGEPVGANCKSKYGNVIELKRRMNDARRTGYGTINKLSDNKWVYTSTDYNYLIITKVELDKGGTYG